MAIAVLKFESCCMVAVILSLVCCMSGRVDPCSTQKQVTLPALNAALSTMQVKAQQEHSELSELMGDFGLENAKGKGIAADHAIEQQFAQSEHDLKQANERVTAVNDAIRELQHLEDFIRSTKPPTEEAVMLTEEIVRQLLEKLNFLRLDFPAQSAPKPV